MILSPCPEPGKEARIILPASKSISNRVLVAAKLAGIDLNTIDGLSESDDTRQLFEALESDSKTNLCIKDGAVPLRFLLAYRAAKNLPCTIQCGERLLQRPIQPMINSLKSMGAEIELMQNTLTLHKGISGFSEVEIEASQSSQFGSAFMLIAPLFPGEKKIRLTGTIASATYLQMTAKVLKEFGIDSVIDGSEIRISYGAYLPQKIQIEKDWSAAAFIYALVAVFDGPETIISGLSEDSLQGDIQVTEIFRELGVETIFTANGIIIRKTGSVKRYINFDFEDCPDLAPPVLTACAALEIDVKIRGLENLRFKESDRIDALKSNLNKFGKDLKQDGECWILESKLPMPSGLIQIDDYNDHRIAMAFSVFTRMNNIQIQNPDCVNKSFPGFWKECKPWFNMEL